MQAYRAIEDFDAAWQSVSTGAARPRLETVLQSIPQAERPDYLRELLAIELEYRSKRGESPSVRDYVQRLAADPQMIESVFAECGIVSADLPAGQAAADEGPAERPQSANRPGKKDNYLSLKAGTEIGNYTIIRLIGQGGMGAVYQAEHRRMRRKVALKMISPDALEHPEALQRFHREAQAMARLEHPNIVTAHDADQAGEIHFLVMQYVDGEDLSTTVKTRGPLEIDKAIRYLMQTAMGLEYAHHEGVIHRDIKPSNLIVNRSGTVKILDMGLARLADSLSEASPEDRNLTQAGNLMGTVDYMAPEQALDAKAADERADIYSLGCTFYYTVTGQKLYGGDTPMKRIMAHRFEPIPSLLASRSDVPDGLDPIFQKMVAKNRADRYQSMTELLTALAPFSTSGSSSGAIGLSSSETAEQSPSQPTSYSEDLVQHRVAAVTPSKAVRTPVSAPDTTAEKTSPSSISDTQFKSRTDEPPATPAKKSAAHSVGTVPNRSGSIQPLAHEPIMQSENVSWRSRAATKDTGAHRRPSATSTRRRLLGAVAGYVGVIVVLAVAYIVFGPADKGSSPTDIGTLVIEAEDEKVTAALGEAGIKFSNDETGEVVTLHPGSNDLKPGHYELKAASLPGKIKIRPKKFHVQPGQTEKLLATLADEDDAP